MTRYAAFYTTLCLMVTGIMLCAESSSAQTDWFKHPENPVLEFGPNGTWDDAAVLNPAVLFDGTRYQMWYTGYDGSTKRIGYATSTDGIVWEKHPDNPVLDLGTSGTWDDADVRSPAKDVRRVTAHVRAGSGV